MSIHHWTRGPKLYNKARKKLIKEIKIRKEEMKFFICVWHDSLEDSITLKCQYFSNWFIDWT